MLHAIYSPEGPEKHLRNLGTLLRTDPDKPDNYLAQFDPLYLKEAFGWRSYPKTDFINLEGSEL